MGKQTPIQPKVRTEAAPLTYQPRPLPAPEAAKYLGVSETTLRRLGLPRRVLGSRRLYDRHDLKAFVNSMRYDVDHDEGGEGDRADCDKLFGAGS